MEPEIDDVNEVIIARRNLRVKDLDKYMYDPKCGFVEMLILSSPAASGEMTLRNGTDLENLEDRQ